MSRRRFRFDVELQAMVEVGADYSGAESRAPVATEELLYGGLQSTEGVDISTRRRHREYMKANGYTIAEDYKGEWARASEERAKAFTPGAGYDSKARREDIGRTIYELEKRGRK